MCHCEVVGSVGNAPLTITFVVCYQRTLLCCCDTIARNVMKDNRMRTVNARISADKRG
jgi:hypothetical protein